MTIRPSHLIVAAALAGSAVAVISQVIPQASGTNVKYNICHHDEGVTATYELLNLPPQAIVDAHLAHQHSLDIIPQFVNPHDGITYGPQGDQSILKNGCVVPSETTVPESTTTAVVEGTTVPDTTIPTVETTVPTTLPVGSTPTTTVPVRVDTQTTTNSPLPATR